MENGFGDHLLSGDEYIESGVVMEGGDMGMATLYVTFLHIKISEAHAEVMAIM